MALEYKPITKLSDLPEENLFTSGHRLCAGCGPAIVARLTVLATQEKPIVVNATGCLEVGSTLYPYSSWKVPWVHITFENAAAVASGIVEALDKLASEGKTKKAPVIAIGGDGGTFDIGIQALSGALERGHKFLYICYDNEAYQNTGIQRSGATPFGAATTTSPAGKVIPGKQERKKDLIGIVLGHHIPYAATATIAYYRDYINKVRKALSFNGPTFIHVLAPCTLGWRYDPSKTVEISRLAVETRFFPIYEVENGALKINFRVPKPKPVEEYLKTQGRFAHLFRPENSHLIKEIQKNVDENWARLERIEKAGQIF
ncbi:MAG: pyruvate ferredoxin oxidoreductase [Thaumarchaeota archaeon]|nr:pyruvate ferredoxin oxidoreductase [Nitrososphaerota archaeon]